MVTMSKFARTTIGYQEFKWVGTICKQTQQLMKKIKLYNVMAPSSSKSKSKSVTGDPSSTLTKRGCFLLPSPACITESSRGLSHRRQLHLPPRNAGTACRNSANAFLYESPSKRNFCFVAGFKTCVEFKLWVPCDIAIYQQKIKSNWSFLFTEHL